MKKTVSTEIEAEVKQPVPESNEPAANNGVMGFDVNPSEIVSIIAGNRVLMLQKGVTGIDVHYQV